MTRAYWVKNRERVLEKNRGYREKNRGNLRAKARTKYARNREKISKERRAYYAINREKIIERTVAYEKLKLESSPELRLRKNLRCRLRQAIHGISKSARTIELLGCPIVRLQIHLESRFRPGMTWENYGPVWHIDHVRPCASFNLTDPEQQKICFHWTNLQPLFAVENIQKGAKYGPL